MGRELPPEAVVVIAGPTASGKSQLALELAERLQSAGRPSAILCADSITVYHGFEIGSAKPNPADRARVPHFLLDLAAPTDRFTAADFARTAREVISRLHAVGSIPLLVGGAGFYLRALLHGMAAEGAEEGGDAIEIKAELTARAEREGWESLYGELLRLDPDSATVIHPRDHYRILRGLQAMRLHGRRWSALNREARAAPPRYPGQRFFALHWEREELRGRVEQRTREMLRAGLVEETRALLESGVPPEARPMQSVGYKECVETLRGNLAEPALEAAIVHSTMRLAKQQMTWFRRERNVEWLRPEFRANLFAALGL
jgi:tRNA dimethylallyltransferase